VHQIPDVTLVVDADEQAGGMLEVQSIGGHHITHRGGVNYGQHPLDILPDKPIVQSSVAMVDGTQIGEPADVRGSGLEIRPGRLHLILNGAHGAGH